MIYLKKIKGENIVRRFIVNSNDANQRLDKYISKFIPQMPKALLYKYIRTKHIKINRKKVDISTRLADGDIVDFYIDEAFFNNESSNKYDFLKAPNILDIVYEDKNILLLNKKPGLLSHPDEDHYSDTLIIRVMKYLYEKGEYDPSNENTFAPSLANRIDRNTGGLVIAAKNAEALRILNEKIKQHEIKKKYLCVVHGILAKKSNTLVGYLTKDKNKNRVYIYNYSEKGSKLIITKYNVIESKNNLSLVEVELLTGRTHQIRAHFAHIGHPLLGDGKYGYNSQNKKYGSYKKQFLYSYLLEFSFETDAGTLNYLKGTSFEAPEVWFKSAFLNGTLKIMKS